MDRGKQMGVVKLCRILREGAQALGNEPPKWDGGGGLKHGAIPVSLNKWFWWVSTSTKGIKVVREQWSSPLG